MTHCRRGVSVGVSPNARPRFLRLTNDPPNAIDPSLVSMRIGASLLPEIADQLSSAIAVVYVGVCHAQRQLSRSPIQTDTTYCTAPYGIPGRIAPVLDAIPGVL